MERALELLPKGKYTLRATENKIWKKINVENIFKDRKIEADKRYNAPAL